MMAPWPAQGNGNTHRNTPGMAALSVIGYLQTAAATVARLLLLLE